MADESGKDDASPDDELSDAKELFKLCQDRENQNRLDYIDDVRFARLGGKEQWPQEIYSLRTGRGLPCLTVNQMPGFIHQVINDCRQNKPAITVRPVDSGADRWTAQILSGLIRHVENISNADAAYDTAVDCSASGGFGYFRVAIDFTHDDSFDKEIYIHRVADPMTIYGDPYSMAVDSSDWNNSFVTELVPKKLFKKKYPDAVTSDFDGADYLGLEQPWIQGDAILTAEWWHREEVSREIVKLSNGWIIEADVYKAEKDLYDALGATVEDSRSARSFKVSQRIMSGAEILEENPWAGKYIPIIPVYGEEVVIEGKRHLRSMIRDGKDPQRNYNYWRSKASESAAMQTKSQWVGPYDAFTGDLSDRWDTVNEVNHAYLPYSGQVPPQKVMPGGPDAPSLQEASSANNDIMSTIGIYNPGRGAPSNEISGKAINARKVESDTGTFHFTDNLSRGIRHLGVTLVDLIPHVYTPGRIIRVLGQDGSENHVSLGTLSPQAPAGPQAPVAQPGMPAMPQPAMPGQAPQMPMQGGGIPQPVATPPQIPQQTPGPQEGQPDYARIYDLALGKYDVVVAAGPGYQTRRQEASDQMMQMVQAFPQLASIIGDLIAKNQDWPGADEIERRLKKMLPPQLQDEGDGQNIPPQLMQQMQQGKDLIQKLSQALQACQQELQKAQSDQSIDMMKANNERLAIAVEQYEAQIKAYDAQTKRGAAVVDAIHDHMHATQPQPSAPSTGVPGMPQVSARASIHPVPIAAQNPFGS